jgi:hypothetical protein
MAAPLARHAARMQRAWPAPPCSLTPQRPPPTPSPAARADQKGKFDELVEDHGVRVLIDPAALMHVLGTKMDFVQDELK